MTMKITAVNASPRPAGNTAELIKAALEGAASAGAETVYYDLYRQPKFTGCISCFGCKLEPNEGKCICRDGLYPILEDIRTSDAVILGSPNYLSEPTAGFRALFERLVFQNLTYRREETRYNMPKTPVLFIMTSNADADYYDQMGYSAMIERYRSTLENFVGETEVMICGNTLQVKDYSRFNWTMFNIPAKQERHETIFPEEKKQAFARGVQLAEKCGKAEE